MRTVVTSYEPANVFESELKPLMWTGDWFFNNVVFLANRAAIRAGIQALIWAFFGAGLKGIIISFILTLCKKRSEPIEPTESGLRHVPRLHLQPGLKRQQRTIQNCNTPRKLPDSKQNNQTFVLHKSHPMYLYSSVPIHSNKRRVRVCAGQTRSRHRNSSCHSFLWSHSSRGYRLPNPLYSFSIKWCGD